MPNRRQALQTLALSPWLVKTGLAQSSAAVKLPPVRAITQGPKFHWRGYYDKFLIDASNRYVLANEVDFEGRSPRSDDVIRVGMIDTNDKDRWIELGQTTAWNWQQGCMLQWRPGHDDEVIWNDRDGDHYVCHILNIKTHHKRTLPFPIYCLSPDGKQALFPDFRRLNDTRPGYGYAGIADPNAEAHAPDNAGIWKLDLQTEKAELIFSFAAAARIPYPGDFSNGAKHWFNHLLFAPDGKRFIFLHRWRGDTEGKSWKTRMFTMGINGQDWYILDPHGKTSHFVWRDAAHVIAFAFHPSRGQRFYVYTDRSDEVSVVGKDQLTVDGHVTYVPGTNDAWLLNDTYPDKERKQNVHLFHIPTERKIPVGAFASPPGYAGEWRCDTHPCCSRDGTFAVFDSTHGGNGRQVYLADLRGLTG